MKLYVLGASGGVGRKVVEEALLRRHSVTAHVRQSSQLSVPGTVQVVRRSPTSPGGFDPLPGHDAVICCVGQRRVSKNPFSKLLSPPDLVEQVTRNLIAAATAAGVQRVVMVSAAGVGDSGPQLNLVMKFLLATSKVGVAYRDLEKAEDLYRQSSLDWVAVRPVTLTDDKPTGNVQVVKAFTTTAKISRTDVAQFLVAAASDKFGVMQRTPQIAG